MEISAGKYHGLRVLADDSGRFRMMAIDQRGSMVSALAKISGRSKDQISFGDVAEVKRLITQVLWPHASAVLTDPPIRLSLFD